MHPRVVIVGAGFGGLQCAKLAGEPVDVTLVDRQNYHLFTPLLYQVASCLLNPSEITAPLRKVLPRRAERALPPGRRRRRRLRAPARAARRRRRRSSTTTLVLATGSVTNYYGNDAIAAHALGLKDLGEALQLRNHVLDCLERADRRRPTPTSGGGCSRSASSAADRRASSTRARSPSSCGSCCRTSTRSSRRPTCASCCSKAATACCRRSSRGCRSTRAASSSGAASTCAPTRSSRRPTTTASCSRDGTELADRVDRVDRGRAPVGRRACTRASRAPSSSASRSTTTCASLGAEHVYAIGDVAAAPDQRRHAAADDRRRPRCRPAATSPARSCGGDRRGAVPLPRQGHDGDDRAPGRGRPDRADPAHRASSAGSPGSSCTSTT